MALLIEALPAEIAELRAAQEAALLKRSELQRQAAEFAAAEGPAREVLEAARATLEVAETDLSLATDETVKALRSACDRGRREFADADEALQRIQRIRCGIVARLADADREIEAAYPPFRDIMQQFGAEVCAAYRPLLVDACAQLARVLRIGWALHEVLPFDGTLGVALSDPNVRDIGPQPGRPIGRLIQGDRVWLDDEDGAAGGVCAISMATRRSWRCTGSCGRLRPVTRPPPTGSARSTPTGETRPRSPRRKPHGRSQSGLALKSGWPRSRARKSMPQPWPRCGPGRPKA